MKIELLTQEGMFIYKWLKKLDRVFSTKITTINIIISIIILVLNGFNNKYINHILLYVSVIMLFIFSILPKVIYNIKNYFEEIFFKNMLDEKDKSQGYLVGVDSRELDEIINYITPEQISDNEWTKFKILSIPYLFLLLYIKLYLKLLIKNINIK